MSVRCCDSVIYQLLSSLITVRFVRICTTLRHNKSTDTFYAVSEEHKMPTKLINEICFSVDTNHFIDIVLIYRTACSYLLFNLTQFIRCFITLHTVRSNIQPITILPLSRTATCFGLNRPSTQRSKTISKCNTYRLNRYSF